MIPRHLLPQIPSDKLDEFSDFLRGHGVRTKMHRLPIEQLKPIQKHINREKVESLKDNPIKLKNPLIVSQGGYVVDGHHRWVAEKELGEYSSVNCLHCFCTVRELVELAHQFDGSFTKSVYESTTYRKQGVTPHG